MDDYCDLREANGVGGARCDEDSCPFWQLVEHVGGEVGQGCAIKHHELLGDEKVAEWLLSVKQRVDKINDPKA
jgi:hypothetical protein